MFASTFIYAQQVSVTFQVDMSKQTVSGDGVHVAGSFQDEAGFAGDWDPSTTALTDGDGDGVYEVTVNLPADSTYQYKFVNGNKWGGDEGVPSACNVGGNRELKVPSSGPHTTPKVCFGSCDPCPTAVDTVAFTIKVDMSQQTVSANGVHVAGDFGAGGYPSWNPSGIALTDGDGDKVYEVTLTLPEGTYPFKFINGNDWPDNEGVPGECNAGGNREYKITGDGDDQSESGFTAMYIAAFGMCPAKDSTDVTFFVDMNNQTVGANGVHLAGAFDQSGLPGWDPSGIGLTDGDGDGVYEVTLRLAEGDYGHKFINGDAWGDDESIPPACNVGGNRNYTSKSNNDAWNDVLTDSVKVCFGECSETCPVQLPPIKVTFRVDMSNEIVNAAGVFIAGSFPGAVWVKDTFKMSDADGNEVYDYVFDSLPVDDYQFKFHNGDCGDPCGEDHDFKTSGCGVDNGIGGFNRYIDLGGVTNDTMITVYVYNSCDESTVGIANTIPNRYKVFPNPASQTVHVNFKESAEGYQIYLRDLNGRVVRSIHAKSNNSAMDVSTLNSGLYLLIIHDNNGGTAYEKLMIH